MSDVPMTQAPVLFQELATIDGHAVGVAQLNAPKSVNALSLDMIRLLDRQLRAWQENPAIACVVLHGAGEKAFCAGGDVRSLYRAIQEQGASATNAAALAFFSEEYRLDYRIHTFGKPVIVWASGIVMGGGMGLMAGASHRIVTETSRIAMPEITIGLFPDVGGSGFLRRMPARTGLFVALTAASLNAADAKAAALADHFLAVSQFDAMCQRLQSARWQSEAERDRAMVSEILSTLAASAKVPLPVSNLQRHAAVIDAMCAGADLAEIVGRIRQCDSADEWLQRAAKSLAAGSPTTAALIWELRQRASSLSLADVFRMELTVAMQCCAHPDFPEGVRALLIEKDGKPRWTPARLEDVSTSWVAGHFIEPDWPSGHHPLHDLA
ncbi:MAG TPA: enoyl-CoA hydratase/isomerase family protein [Povalibacter sp.]|uniref:enoyl-CoA hydratase/isomerase family protein n=1 Tax=Povalibacter sp. TaxID=1962978 RepID=UPI002BAF5507|nr:enoyl-CoA hydratase/isomerase family protein [Povalibacter sp.]HMN46387.1 enoyl-CoA hydratase/isomerase family protein [Povalibacter sp.]